MSVASLVFLTEKSKYLQQIVLLLTKGLLLDYLYKWKHYSLSRNPWGTPANTGTHIDVWQLKITLWYLFLENFESVSAAYLSYDNIL